MTRRFVFDVESTSTVDLRKTGPAAYWEHPDTQIIVLTWKVDSEPTRVWRPGDAVPYWVPELAGGYWRVVAHNFIFEWMAWQHRLGRHFGWGRVPSIGFWDCTMARSLYWGLPAALGDVCEALDLPTQKDKDARSLMLRMARPRSTSPLTWWHETDPDKVRRLTDYCVQDTEAEAGLDDKLPAVPVSERQIFQADWAMNVHGLRIDRPLVDKLLLLTQAETARLNTRIQVLTQGRVTSSNQVAKLTAVLAEMGCEVESLARDAVSEALSRPGVPGSLAGDVLAVRAEAAKASTAKLTPMLLGASPFDDRARCLFQYGGAGRTMRWAGRRVQFQNMPRGFANANDLIPLVMAGATPAELELFLPMGVTVMDGVSAMLRGCFVPRPGGVLVSVDLAQIEARTIGWLAGQQDILDVFARGDDVYTYTAAKLGSSSRLLGKIVTLALGFSMGAVRFMETALTYGVQLTLTEAEDIVQVWRKANGYIVAFWYDLDRVARLIAVSPHGTEARVGRVVLRRSGRSLQIILPSGRRLTYHQIDIRDIGDGRHGLMFMGVDPKVKTWCEQRTYGGKLAENITQAVARDVMAEAMVALDTAAGLPIVATVHDELVAEVRADRGCMALARMLDVLKTPPAWAAGLPIGAEGWVGERYRK